MKTKVLFCMCFATFSAYGVTFTSVVSWVRQNIFHSQEDTDNQQRSNLRTLQIDQAEGNQYPTIGTIGYFSFRNTQNFTNK